MVDDDGRGTRLRDGGGGRQPCSLAETFSGHGLMVDEPTSESLAAVIGRVLADDDLRRTLERLAVERGSTLRSRQTTRRTLEVLRSIGTPQRSFGGESPSLN